ncbi:MAG: haloacid dehalogenase-like hydrolase [Ruminococcus sp.]|nr:haloacid dehalogenase-like hydrolase [Ruminococcus sp.]
MTEKKRNPSFIWQCTTIALAVALLAVSCLYILKLTSDSSDDSNASSASQTEVSKKDALSLWTDDAPLKKQLTEYISKITDKDSKDFIPVDRRIAVFDFDGTLFCETDPVYFDYRLFYYRVTEDPDYKDKASAVEKETAAKIKTMMDTGESAKGLEVAHGKGVASAFAGMTVGEFNDYVKMFREKQAPSYNNMKNGEAYYKPMIQVVNYLKANDFTVYVVSGTDRFIVRGAIEDSVLDVPPRQIIGSDETIVASHQGSEDGLTYQYKLEDQVITGGDFIIKNLKMNKVSVIQQEIGLQPVLSFGNSSGDNSMANFVIDDNPYPSAAYMLCCDDLERENGNMKKADAMRKSCEENGWTAISMKNDWTTIYGDNVTKK